MKNFETYLRENNYHRNIDHSIRATVIPEKVKFYIHPINASGDTLDYEVISNALIPLDMKDLSFGQVIALLKQGKKVYRKGWNGKGMFIYMVGSTLVDKEFLRNAASLMPICDNTGTAHFNAHIDMKTADGSVCVGWLASQTDMLAEDWEVIE